MKLIVGLGNPDAEYKNTFHNLGFMCVEAVADNLGLSFTKDKCRALIAEGRIGAEKVILAKPQTYMNLSGESVRELVSFYKIPLKDIIVIYDDYDLKKGFIRIRENGSAGTHNGMRNIIKELGSSEFARVRVGFHPEEESKIPLINYVLSGIKEEDKKTYEKVIATVGKIGESFASGCELQKIMQQYNGKIN
jgi:PTH1 family peptidyl-tRNA hydrolase